MALKSPPIIAVPPVVLLDGKMYKLVDSLDSLGVPSLKNVKRLVVKGAHRFADGEPLSGDVEIG